MYGSNTDKLLTLPQRHMISEFYDKEIAYDIRHQLKNAPGLDASVDSAILYTAEVARLALLRTRPYFPELLDGFYSS